MLKKASYLCPEVNETGLSSNDRDCVQNSGNDKGNVKLKLAENISKELLSSGIQLSSQEEFNTLVEAEYVRKKHRLASQSRPGYSSCLPDVRQSRNPCSEYQELFNCYDSVSSENQACAMGSNQQIEFTSAPRWNVPSQDPYPSSITGFDQISIRNFSNIAEKLEERKIMYSPKKREDESACGSFNNLSDAEILVLYKNFTKLSKVEMKDFIHYIKKLEEVNPRRIRFLKRSIFTK